MAMHNEFDGVGQVQTIPKITKNDNGEYLRGLVIVGTIRAKRDAGNGLENVRYDCPLIRTGNPRHIEEINSWKVNDMARIKGTITSREVPKKSICPHCGAQNINKSVMTFINPIYCERMENNISHEMGLSLLKRRCEISNKAQISGMLVRDPEVYTTEAGASICQFQLAILRKFRIIEDAPDRKVDFIWVKAFGKHAKECYENLKKGSTVFIDGFLQTRDFEKEIVCFECEKEYVIKDTAVEVVPYAVEYLRNCMGQEEIEQLREETAKTKADELLKSLSEN